MTDDSDSSKASFKLDLIETVNADPVMEASDVKIIAAYAAVMAWPKREAWLSISRARAMTGLSERQVTNSRKRLSGDNRGRRSYLVPLRKDGLTTVFRVENPWREDSRQHVAIMTAHFREAQKERQAQRRLEARPVSATDADTDMGLSHSPGACDVPATNAGNSPPHTPQEEALKKGNKLIKVGSVETIGNRNEDYAFPIPTSESDGERLLDMILAGVPTPDPIRHFFLEKLLAGDLLKSVIDTWRDVSAAA